MRQLLNTLFITSPDIYLSLDGENVVANREKEVLARYPLHTLSGILSFPPSWVPAPSEISPCPFALPTDGFWPEYVGKAAEMCSFAARNIELLTTPPPAAELHAI